MKRVFQAGTGIFGEGMPKICVPIVDKSREGIWKKAEDIERFSVDIAEWRVDFYEAACKAEEVIATLKGIKRRLGQTVLLFTFRTSHEGGNGVMDQEDYYQLNREAALGGADLVDVEAFLDVSRTAEQIKRLQDAGCRVVASSHDFKKTPSVTEMVRRLKCMEEMGADVAKLAVMPQDRQDVLNLLQATVTADEELSVPVVTMSMGHMGVISRMCGSLTGSAMTFAALEEASAPGQIPLEKMQEALKITG